MGRSAHCPPRKRALPSLPLGDANRGVCGRLAGSNRESPPHRPPERRAFPFPGRPCRRWPRARNVRTTRFLARSGPVFVQSESPVRTPGEHSTVRALGRAAAAVVLLRAILRRGGSREGGRGSPAREFESVSRVAGELARSADVEGVVRTLLDELAEL